MIGKESRLGNIYFRDSEYTMNLQIFPDSENLVW